jgi:dihydroorotase
MQITITKPDDWHIHLRDKAFLTTTVAHAAERFCRVIVMPNLKPPILTVQDAVIYYQNIVAITPNQFDFQPLMTLYLTDQTTPNMIKEVNKSDLVIGCKLYPAHATTHAEAGVTEFENIYSTLAMMEELDLPLLIHGEVTDSHVDIFDRERIFIETKLRKLIEHFPTLRIVLEHITTKEAIDFVKQSSTHVAATITAHHLLLNRNALFQGGIRPHHYCLPILKRREHQEALLNIATSAHPKFFFGSDSAPHTQNSKENACGCAGIYTGHASIELLTEVFHQENALDNLQTFCSINGANFYKLPLNQQKLTLINEPWQVPSSLAYGSEKLIPFRADSTIDWKIRTA